MGDSMTIVLLTNQAAPLGRALNPADPDCSPACEVILEAVRRLEAAATEVVLDRGADGIAARLALAHNGSRLTLACHVVDALTLALRAGPPIYATRAARAGSRSPRTGLEATESLLGLTSADRQTGAAVPGDEERDGAWRGGR